MAVRLLRDVALDIMRAAAAGNSARIEALLEETVRERAGVMHERAQRAEGRAAQAEKALERLSRRVGLQP